MYYNSILSSRQINYIVVICSICTTISWVFPLIANIRPTFRSKFHILAVHNVEIHKVTNCYNQFQSWENWIFIRNFCILTHFGKPNSHCNINILHISKLYTINIYAKLYTFIILYLHNNQSKKLKFLKNFMLTQIKNRSYHLKSLYKISILGNRRLDKTVICKFF